MNPEKRSSCLIAAILSVCLGFGGTASMVTGLALDASLPALFLLSVLISSVFCLLLQLPKGGRYVLLLLGGFLLLAGHKANFRENLFSMLGTILTYYENAYGIPVPELFLNRNGTSHLWPLLSIHALTSAMVCWTLIRRYPIVLSVFLSVLPLASCFVVVDTVPATWCILLWFFGLITLLLTHPVRLRDEAHGNRLTGIVSGPVALCLFLLSLCIPQHSYQTPNIPFTDFTSFWEWTSEFLPFTGPGIDGILPTVDSLSPHLDLSSMGQRKLKNTPVMEVSANFSGTVYLRGRDYDIYDGKSWQADTQRTESKFLATQNYHSYGTVNIRTLNTHGQLFVPYYPTDSMVFHGGLAENPEQLAEYSFACVAPLDYSGLPSTSDGVDGRYLELPYATRTRAQTILQQIARSTPGIMDAQAIAAYVHDSARYDLNTEAMPDNADDFALWFLEASETGYCVHFASATTVLLRAAGIPARYVEGYILQANVGRVTTVPESNAHAWVEYYETGIGWRILEATPGYTSSQPTEPTETEPTETEPTESEPTEPTETEPTEPTPTESETTAPTETVPATTQPQTPPSTTKPTREFPPWLRSVLWTAGLILLLLAAVWGQWYLRRRKKYRQLHKGSTNAQALAHYREAKRLSRLNKLPLPNELEALAERACFSHHRITAEELRRFSDFLRDCTAQLKTKSFLHRLIYRFLLAAY